MTKIPTNPLMDARAATDLSLQSQGAGRAKNLLNRDLSSEKEIEKAASGFEALLLHQMMKSMWATVEQNGLLGEDSNQSQIYRDMFHQAIAESIADGKGIGVKEFLRGELVKSVQTSKK